MDGRVVVRWLAVVGVDPAALAGWRAVLDDEERARADRFHFERDRVAYIGAHALTRTLLSAYGTLRPGAWRFEVGAHGKPALVQAGPCFNLSHTRGLVACAVAACAVGVDVEAMDRPQTGEGIAGRYFTAVEQAQIAAVPEAERRAVFFRLWTMKEAVMKATGLGFHLPLDAFSVTLEPAGVRFRSADEGPAWWFEQWGVGPAHRLAVAVRMAEAPVFDVRQADLMGQG